jgi:predicted HD phosphohydrolase
MRTVIDTMEAELRRLAGGSPGAGRCFGQDFITHAARCAGLAEAAGNHPDFILACLFHDIGSLLHEPVDHAAAGSRWLRARFHPSVSEPVRLHECALAYLVSTDPIFASFARRSGALAIARLTEDELISFEKELFFDDAIALAEIDVLSAHVRSETPPLRSLLRYLPPVMATPAGGGESRRQATDRPETDVGGSGIGRPLLTG